MRPRKQTVKCIRQDTYWSIYRPRSVFAENVFLIRSSQATPISLHRLLIRVGFRYLHPLDDAFTASFRPQLGIFSSLASAGSTGVGQKFPTPRPHSLWSMVDRPLTGAIILLLLVCPLKLNTSLVQPVFSLLHRLYHSGGNELPSLGHALFFLGYRSGLWHVCGPSHA